MIWATAFEQEPSGSLPADHALIAAHLEMDTRIFNAHADILLRGFYLCSDGRLYHPAVVERVTSLLGYRNSERERKENYRKRMKNIVQRPAVVPRDRRGKNAGETAQEQEQEQEQDEVTVPVPTVVAEGGVGGNVQPLCTPRAKRGSRLLLSELPADWLAWAKSERPDLDPHKTWDLFRDYWAGVPGTKGTKSDWLATWRNWVRRETATTAKTGVQHGRRETTSERMQRNSDRIWEDAIGTFDTGQ